MHFLLMPVLLVTLAQEPNAAEKLFRASEKKLTDADYAQITIKGVAKAAKGEITMNGTVLTAKGNKSRLDLTGEMPGGGYKLASVSDGTKTKMIMTQGDKAGKESIQDTPKNANAMFAGIASRTGLLTGMFMVVRSGGPNQKPAELDEMVTVSDFALGKKEKVGTRQAQRIDYKLAISVGTNKETVPAQVWLDTETNLPLKRVLSGQKGDEKFEVTETYDIRLNGKIEASKFELPK